MQNKSLTSQRNSNVEMLRILIMYGILLWHVTMHGFGFSEIKGNETIEYEFANSLCVAMFAPCVNLFVLISGYYGMKFRARTLARFEAQAIFYSISLAAAAWLFFGNQSIKSLNVIFPIVGFRWWFLTIYITLLIIAPIVNEGISKLTKRQHLVIIILLFFLNGICSFLKQTRAGGDLSSFIHLYLIGQYLYRYKSGYRLFSKQGWTVMGSLICFVVNFLFIFLTLKYGNNAPLGDAKPTPTMLYLNYSNPIIILQSIFILCTVLSFKPTYIKNINMVSKHVFSVYLITEVVGLRLYIALKNIFVNNLFLGLLASALVFAICILIEIPRNAVYEWGVKRYLNSKAK